MEHLAKHKVIRYPITIIASKSANLKGNQTINITVPIYAIDYSKINTPYTYYNLSPNDETALHDKITNLINDYYYNRPDWSLDLTGNFDKTIQALKFQLITITGVIDRDMIFNQIFGTYRAYELIRISHISLVAELAYAMIDRDLPNQVFIIPYKITGIGKKVITWDERLKISTHLEVEMQNLAKNSYTIDIDNRYNIYLGSMRHANIGHIKVLTSILQSKGPIDIGGGLHFEIYH